MKEIGQTNSSKFPIALGVEVVVVGEMYAGEEDPMYFPDETKLLLNMCTFDLEICLSPLFLDRRGSLEKKEGEEVFKRLAFEEFHCGACLLQIDRGVEYYLESIEDAEESRSPLSIVCLLLVQGLPTTETALRAQRTLRSLPTTGLRAPITLVTLTILTTLTTLTIL